MSRIGFNSQVAARTRTAEQIIEATDLVAKLEDLGGLRRDMEAIRDAGLEAEAANLGQSQAKSAGKVTTMEVLAKYAKVQKENSAVMSVVNAVCSEVKRAGGKEELVKKHEVRKSKAQEAVRAEIAKDDRVRSLLAQARA